MVHFHMAAHHKPKRSQPLRVYNFKKAYFDLFSETLYHIPWNVCFLTNSIEDAWSKFKDLLFCAADLSISKLPSERTRNKKTWLSEETLKMLKAKRRAFKKAHSEKDINYYKHTRKAAKSLTRRDHKQNIEDISKTISLNPKQFWNWIANMRGGSRHIPELHHLGSTFKTTSAKCKVLNSYFAAVFTK